MGKRVDRIRRPSEAALKELVGRVVQLSLRDGRNIRARILSLDADALTCADTEAGLAWFLTAARRKRILYKELEEVTIERATAL